ncbi:MAG TPA: hypothetical protein VKC66_20785 [Xanthobacteraceae bacterium]|nr:hypothetical protein [Xanthobacteraceae bacterium]
MLASTSAVSQMKCLKMRVGLIDFLLLVDEISMPRFMLCDHARAMAQAQMAPAVGAVDKL